MSSLKNIILALPLSVSTLSFAGEKAPNGGLASGNLLALGDVGNGAPLAQPQVSAEKAVTYTVLPTLYSSVEMRHAVVRAQDDGKVIKSVPNLSLRPTLGMKYIDGRLDSAFTFIFRKNPGEMTATRDVFYNETWVKLLKGTNGFIGPYAYSEFDREQMDFRYSKVGLNFTGEKSIEGSWTLLKLKAYVEPKVLIIGDHYKKSKDYAVTPRNDTSQASLALDSSGSSTMERRDVTYLDDLGASFKLYPANWTNFYTGVSIDVTSRWVPQYVARDTSSGVETNFDGYERRSLTFTRWSLSYKFSDLLTLINQLGHYDGGLYEYEIDNRFADYNHEINSARWENRLSLTATLL